MLLEVNGIYAASSLMFKQNRISGSVVNRRKFSHLRFTQTTDFVKQSARVDDGIYMHILQLLH